MGVPLFVISDTTGNTVWVYETRMLKVEQVFVGSILVPSKTSIKKHDSVYPIHNYALIFNQQNKLMEWKIYNQADYEFKMEVSNDE